jgi:hypothetical protein
MISVMAAIPTTDRLLAPKLCRQRSAISAAKLVCDARPMLAPRYTVRQTMKTGRRPRWSEKLAVNRGKRAWVI